ncbi:hypothetical protein H0H93_008551 [Arthromyces matolae]|nr:hypothetical protein H0H93_008551 [Arthromyces matolae]
MSSSTVCDVKKRYKGVVWQRVPIGTTGNERECVPQSPVALTALQRGNLLNDSGTKPGPSSQADCPLEILFRKHSTRSGVKFSPFVIAPIYLKNFNLATSVKYAVEAADYEDDVLLTAPPDDISAVQFWESAPPTDVGKRAPEAHSTATVSIIDTILPPVIQTSLAPTPSPPKAIFGGHQPPSLKRAADGDLDPGKRSKNARVHGKRAKRQAERAKSEGNGFHPRRPKVVSAVVGHAEPILTKLNATALPTTAAGYTAQPAKRPGEGEYLGSLEDLLKDGYHLIKWDGKPLVSDDGRVFGVLVGQVANDRSWIASCQKAFEAIQEGGDHEDFVEAETQHCRGNFPAINVGVTMGFGATYPTNLSRGAHTKMLDRLLKDPHIIRIANFVDAAFNLWAPDLYRRYTERLDPLFNKLQYLRRIFDKCVFPTAAFNFGGNVVTKAHRDCMNSAIGWCGIIALGTFNPTRGGHIAFPDLKLVVEFPPASLIFIPSATLTHGNVAISDGERASFTLYCSGGLFRYVVNGYRTESQLAKDDPKEYSRICELKTTRWMEDLKLYSNIDALLQEVEND